MANATGEGEAMYASALESAEMILDCWMEFYPQLVKQAEEEVEVTEVTEEAEMTEEENDAFQLACLEEDADWYSRRNR
jgi:hypothetical protein